MEDGRLVDDEVRLALTDLACSDLGVAAEESDEGMKANESYQSEHDNLQSLSVADGEAGGWAVFNAQLVNDERRCFKGLTGDMRHLIVS